MRLSWHSSEIIMKYALRYSGMSPPPHSLCPLRLITDRLRVLDREVPRSKRHTQPSDQLPLPGSNSQIWDMPEGTSPPPSPALQRSPAMASSKDPSIVHSWLASQRQPRNGDSMPIQDVAADPGLLSPGHDSQPSAKSELPRIVKRYLPKEGSRTKSGHSGHGKQRALADIKPLRVRDFRSETEGA